MIAETIGSGNYERATHMNGLYAKSRKEKPRCIGCSMRLAYDRANESSPTCEPCHRKLTATGETPRQLINRQRGLQAAKTRHSGGYKLPNLRAIRESKAMSKTALAEKAGIDHHTVSNIELRDSLATPTTIAGLTRALEVSEQELRGAFACQA